MILEVKMNKQEFVNAVYEKSNLTKRDCKLCLDAILDVIKDALKNGNSITLSNFGKFKVNEVKQKQMYSFKTGKTHIMPSRKTPSFKASEQLKQIVK